MSASHTGIPPRMALVRDLVSMVRVLPDNRLEQLVREVAREAHKELTRLERPRLVVDNTREVTP